MIISFIIPIKQNKQEMFLSIPRESDNKYRIGEQSVKERVSAKAAQLLASGERAVDSF